MDHEGAQRGPGRLAGPAFFLPVACRRRALQKFPAILQSQLRLNVPALPRGSVPVPPLLRGRRGRFYAFPRFAPPAVEAYPPQEAKRPGLRPFQQAGPQVQFRLGRPSFFGRQRRTHRAGGSGEAVPLWAARCTQPPQRKEKSAAVNPPAFSRTPLPAAR